MNKIRKLETPLLAEEYVRTRPQREKAWRREEWYLGTVLILFFLLIAGGAWLACLVHWAYFFLMPTGFCLFVLAPRFRPWPLRVADEMWRRLAQVPKEKTEAARMFYGADREYPWMFSAIECEEAHVPGDCPLCGAE